MKYIYILGFVIFLKGCLFLPMTITNHIDIENNSGLKMLTYINYSYPDTSFVASRGNRSIQPYDKNASISVVNEDWECVFKRHRKVTVFFGEWISWESYNQGEQMNSDIYGKLILSQAKLDSLEGKIRFPQDVRVTEAYYEAIEKAAADSLESQ